MRRLLIVAAMLAASPAAASGDMPGPCIAASGCVRVAPVELLRLVDQYQANGRLSDAETLLRGLSSDADRELRTEARFRLAMLREQQGDRAGAAGSLRQLLVDRPEAQRPRLELARMLALMGDEGGARRELRVVSATGLPDDVARAVDRFSQALRSTRSFGGSFELAVAPDSNINRATARDTVDTVIAPILLDEDAKARSGVGLALGGQAFWRLRLGERASMLTRLSARGDIYGRGRFNDIGVNLAVGPELRIGSSRLRPAAIASRRWFGGERFSDGIGGSVNWLRPLSRRSQIEAEATLISSRHPRLQAQDGLLIDGNVAYDLALSARSSGRVSARMTRQGAAEPGLATTSLGGDMLMSHLVMGQVVFGQVGLSRLEADRRLALFPERRQDTRIDLSAGLVLRGISFNGLSPLVRVTRTINRSTVDLFDFARNRIEFALSRAF